MTTREIEIEPTLTVSPGPALARLWRLQLVGPLGFANFAVTAILIYFFVNFAWKDGIRMFDLSWRSIGLAAYSLLTANVLILLAQTATERWPVARALVLGLLSFAFVGVHAYHLQTRYPLDWMVLRDNAGVALWRESLGVMLSYFRPGHLVIVAVAWLALPVAEVLRARRGGAAPLPSLPNQLVRLAVLASVYLTMVFLPWRTQDEVTGLLRQWTSATFSRDALQSGPVEGFPYLRDAIAGGLPEAGAPGAGARPNILLVMVESFSAALVERRSPEGTPFTPVFDGLIPRGVSVDRFYGNSVQTCRGQEATLLSVIPSMRGKLFTDYPTLRFKAFPQFLAEAGYRTVFVQAAEHLSFDDTGRFMARAGVQESHSAYEFLSVDDRKQIWGWGPEDGVLYRRTLEHLDRVHAQHPDQPVFALVATIANHLWFEPLAPEKRALYPDPQAPEQNYANLLHLGDRQLQELIDGIQSRPWMKNTVVIITADHSHPMNEHGISHTENGFYEESFRIPLLILWEGRLAPRRLPGPFSQLDLAPTILDLAGIHQVKNHFLGRSIFAPPVPDRPVFLVQPYAGGHLGVVDPPYKLIWGLTTRAPLLFDLAADPMERTNLAGTGAGPVEARLRESLRDVFRNQQMLERNRLWP
jgi:arylsulfatase A-like enzyme